MRTLRNALLILVVMVVLAFSTDSLARRAYCADCSKGGAVDNSCEEAAQMEYDECCYYHGCPPFVNYCTNQMRETYNGCVILKGCPNLAE